MGNKLLTEVDAFIFDLGDVLFSLQIPLHNYHQKFLRQICGTDFEISNDELTAAHNIAEQKASAHLIGMNVQPRYTLSTDDWILFNKALLEELGVVDNIQEKAVRYHDLWEELFETNPQTLKSSAKDVLKDLKSYEYKLGIATNWDYDPSDLLTKSKILRFFDSVQWSSVVGYRKPSPYLLIMNTFELGVNPLRCVFIGNQNKDMEAAKRAGMKPVLLDESHKHQPSDEVLIIRDLIELLDYLE